MFQLDYELGKDGHLLGEKKRQIKTNKTMYILFYSVSFASTVKRAMHTHSVYLINTFWYSGYHKQATLGEGPENNKGIKRLGRDSQGDTLMKLR